MDRFVGKVALITGAASGIGRASALRLASEGARVVGWDINEEGLRGVVDEINAGAGAGAGAGADAVALAVPVDVTDEQGVEAAVDTTLQWAGGIDVLANVAGGGFYRTVEETTTSEFVRLLDLNLVAPFRLARLCAPYLKQRRGAIVNVASAAGLNGRVYLSAYTSAKGGLVALSRGLAVEFAPEVRVNALCPGAVDTPLLSQFQLPENADFALVNRHPALSQRKATAEEMAASLAYLASDEAGSTTGIALLADGGSAA